MVSSSWRPQRGQLLFDLNWRLFMTLPTAMKELTHLGINFCMYRGDSRIVDARTFQSIEGIVSVDIRCFLIHQRSRFRRPIWVVRELSIDEQMGLLSMVMVGVPVSLLMGRDGRGRVWLL